MYCLDTDVISAVVLAHPPLHLVRRLARTPESDQHTTAITIGELLYGAVRAARPELEERLRPTLESSLRVLPFDRSAAEVYGSLRVELERRGERLDDPDLRIASIALSRDLTLVSGNVRHFERIPGLRVENWLAET